MTTKLELLQAAQAAAALSLTLTGHKEIHAARDAAFDACAVPDTNRQFFNDHFQGARHQYHLNQDEPVLPAKSAPIMASVLLTLAMIAAFLLDWIHGSAATVMVAMAWPTTGSAGAGNAAAGQYIASGTGTTLLWGTNNFMTPTGWLTITKISQKTIVAFKDELPNGDGLTAGQVIGIDGFRTEIEVRDDVNQVTSALTVGQRITVVDGGGLYPGGARGASYSGIITDNGWDTAPKTPAGRTLTVEKFILIS